MGLHKACEECIAARKAKFGSRWNEVKCNGIYEDPLETLDTSSIQGPDREQQLQALRVLMDPVAWIKAEVGLELRWYQELMVRCTAIQKMARNGRRTGKSVSMAAHALWKAFTSPKKKLLMMAPLDLQVNEFFNYLDDWISKSPNIKASIKARRKGPQTIEFKNGSRILGLTAGTKAGHSASSARGQEADGIYLDEADYLSPSDITTIFMLLVKTDENAIEEKYVFAGSTPSGRRQHFYQWSINPVWKEFHIPSTMSPTWDADEEKRMRELLPTENEWQREAMAEFGNEMVGVFRQDLVDNSLKMSEDLFHNSKGMWDYSQSRPIPGCIYVIGVDWNTAANGVQIVVAEHNPALITPEDLEKGIRGRFRIAKRLSIEDKEYTQTKAVAKIIELNEIWDPGYIYVDQGYGELQIEELRRVGAQRPDTNIIAKLKPIDFGSTIEIRDPKTKTPIKKHVKPYTVNTTVSMFEKQLILLNNHDRDLEKQIRDFSVEHVSPVDGRPVYSQGNDHALIAFCLCMLAFNIEYTDLGHPTYTSKMAAGVEWGKNRGKSLTDLTEEQKIKIVEDEEKKKNPFINFKNKSNKLVSGRSIPGDPRLGNSTLNRKTGWLTPPKFYPTRSRID